MHVRVCPECDEEYRPDIVLCADCGAELQDRLVDEAQPYAPAREVESELEPPPGNYRPISWAGHASELVPLADRLVALEIPLRIRPRESEPGEPGKGFDLLVRDEERDAALAAMAELEQTLGNTPVSADFDPSSGYRRCPACATEIRPGAVECSECGLAVAEAPGGHVCPQCGAELVPDEATCAGCGFGLP